MTNYLLPIADRVALAWIVTKQRTALGAHRLRQAESLQVEDQLFLYTTTGCFGAPARDPGRIIGVASTTQPARILSKPVRFAARSFPIAIDFEITSLAPFRSGVALAPLMQQLDGFPNKTSWGAYLRQSLVKLTSHDADVLSKALRHVAGSYEEHARTYAGTAD